MISSLKLVKMGRNEQQHVCPTDFHNKCRISLLHDVEFVRGWIRLSSKLWSSFTSAFSSLRSWLCFCWSFWSLWRVL